MSLIQKYSDLVVFRTFSKVYGLLWLRIGCLAGILDVVNTIRKTCAVYSVNTIAYEAAYGALNVTDYIERTRRYVREQKGFLKKELKAMGLTFIPGEGYYIMIRLPTNDTLAYRTLMGHGIMIRIMMGFCSPNYIRINISDISVMEAFIHALRKVVL